MSLSYFSEMKPNPNKLSTQTHNQDQSFLTFQPTQIQFPSNSQYLSNNNLTISQSFVDPIVPIEPSYQYYDNDHLTSSLFTPSDGYINDNTYLNPNSPSFYLNPDTIINNNDNYYYETSLLQYPNPIVSNRHGYEDYYEPIGGYGGFIPNPPVFFPEFVEGEDSSSAVVMVGNDGEDYDNKKKTKNCINGGGGSGENVSAQSIAARQRRRRISEKTQELGKLIPGGQRMNTAEMFHAAFKHIKFLQAQVGILELMLSLYHHHHQHNTDLKVEEKDDKEEEENQEEEECVIKEMAAAVTCPRIQEKLHWKEKCLVPKTILKRLINHPQIINTSVALLLHDFILTLNI